jgi:plastocyanin
MKKQISLIILSLLVVFLFVAGCAKTEEQAGLGHSPLVKVPELGQVEEQEEDASAEETPQEADSEEIADENTPEPSTSSEEETKEEKETEEIEEIPLNPDKTMGAAKTVEEKTVKPGTTLKWKNYDSWPHVLTIQTGEKWNEQITKYGESERLLEGDSWSFTFEEKGRYLVRDVFSGDMRMYVVVK